MGYHGINELFLQQSLDILLKAESLVQSKKSILQGEGSGQGIDKNQSIENKNKSKNNKVIVPDYVTDGLRVHINTLEKWLNGKHEDYGANFIW